MADGGRPASKTLAKLYASAQDVMSANSDRCFQDIRLFLAGAAIPIRKYLARIFDLEWAGNRTHFDIRKFWRRVEMDGAGCQY